MAVSSIINRQMVNVSDSTTTAIARTVGVVESPMTLNVPSSDFPTIQSAMDWIEARILLATVTIQIADGTYNLTSRLSFNHPNYMLVSIDGNQENPSNVVLNFSGDSNPLFYIRNCGLRLIRGIKIAGGSKYGISAQLGGVINSVSDVILDGQTQAAIYSTMTSSIFAYDISITNAEYGVWCFRNSYIGFLNLECTNCNVGVLANKNSIVSIQGTRTFSGNNTDYNPTLNSGVNSDGSQIST